MHEEDYLKVMGYQYERGARFDTDLYRRWQKVLSGYEGERAIKNLIHQFASADWPVISDYAFSWQENKAQSDLLLVLAKTVIVFEVKNYQHEFSYVDGVCKYADNETQNDIMATFTRSSNYLERILLEFDPEIELRRVMVFSNPFGNIYIDPASKSRLKFTILEYRHMKRFLEGLKDEFSWLNSNRLVQPGLIKHLDNFRRDQKEYLPAPLSLDQLKSLKTGIICSNCRSFSTSPSWQTILCQECGCRENKYQSAQRTAIEWTYITNGHPELVTVSNVSWLVSDLIGRKTIYNAMHTSLYQVKNGKYTYYKRLD